MIDIEKNFKKINEQKFLSNGFKLENKVYKKTYPLFDDFLLEVYITKEKEYFKVFDKTTMQEYILINLPSISSPFLAKMRNKISEILSTISNDCYINQKDNIFKYILTKYGVNAKFPFKKQPTFATFSKEKKWFVF